MIWGSRFAKFVIKSFTRKRTSTGVAGPISLTTEARCGGAAVSKERTNLVVSSLSMNVKKTMMKKMMTTTKKKTKLNS